MGVRRSRRYRGGCGLQGRTGSGSEWQSADNNDGLWETPRPREFPPEGDPVHVRRKWRVYYYYYYYYWHTHTHICTQGPAKTYVKTALRPLHVVPTAPTYIYIATVFYIYYAVCYVIFIIIIFLREFFSYFDYIYIFFFFVVSFAL